MRGLLASAAGAAFLVGLALVLAPPGRQQNTEPAASRSDRIPPRPAPVGNVETAAPKLGFCARAAPTVFPVAPWTPEKSLAAARALLADEKAGKPIDPARSEAVYDHLLLLHDDPHCREVEAVIDAASSIDTAAHAYLMHAPDVELTVTGRRKGGFGAIAIADFSVRNREKHAVKDVRFGCSFFAASGTTLSTARGTIFQTFAPSSAKAVRGFDIGFIDAQTAKAACAVNGAEWVQ